MRLSSLKLTICVFDIPHSLNHLPLVDLHALHGVRLLLAHLRHSVLQHRTLQGQLLQKHAQFQRCLGLLHLVPGMTCIASWSLPQLSDAHLACACCFISSLQTTIGYGVRFIDARCHAPTAVLVIQMLVKTCVSRVPFSILKFDFEVLRGSLLVPRIMDAFVIGLVYARLSSPLQRKHTIFISDNACIARRDGVLKLMFRLADVRERQVVNPLVKAFLYTWEERLTSEGEYVPVRVQPLELEYIDRIALLPVYERRLHCSFAS